MADALKLAEATAAAVAAENATGAPAELLIAQWAIESSNGERAPGQNYFGIKAYPGCYGTQLLRTREWFTDVELAEFLSKGHGRTAVFDAGNTVITSGGRRKYIVHDLFATFPSVAACFEKRAQLFRAGKYKQFADAYDQDHDLEKLIRGISPVYATDPNYGDALLGIIRQQNVLTALAAARAPGSGGTVA
jgi:flagellar protein FlgJ